MSTPPRVVSLVWRLVRNKRSNAARVLALGAGDGRFAVKGNFSSYKGIEIDPAARKGVKLPKNAFILTACAFKVNKSDYDTCVGNPPYARHHDIEKQWRRRISSRICKALGIEISGIGNLYLYFMCLAIMRTNAKGHIAFVIPFEWVSRPSAKSIRDFLKAKGWGVSVYRFQNAIFDDVMTTASITIIDKQITTGEWKYFDVGKGLKVTARKGISGSRYSLLAYAPRDIVWARRGISPGGQQTFVLTEAERIENGLTKTDVLPCITTLKHLPLGATRLTRSAFDKHYVHAGQRCWLIRVHGRTLSKRAFRPAESHASPHRSL